MGCKNEAVCENAVQIMSIQIFGTKKSSDTRKAERFFKERGVKFQSGDLKEKSLSKGEFQSVLKQPIVRNGKQATVGYQPDVWETWSWGEKL